MKPLQLRTSLTLAYTAVLSVVLTAVGIGFHSALVRQLDTTLADALEEKSRALHRFLIFENGRPTIAFDESDPAEAAFVADATRYYQVYDARDGRLLVQSPGMQAAGLQYTPAEVAEFLAQPDPRDFATATGRLRVSTFLLTPSPGEEYVIQIGEPLASIDSALAAFDRILWIGIVGGLLIAALLGRWLAGRALAPLSRLATATQAIDIRNLNDRVETRGTGDELDQVASAFNQTLARVESSVGEMRQFSAALAHELRTPIAILRGEAEYERTHPLPQEERQERLVSQLDEYDRLTRLINQILTLARAEAGEIPLSFAPVSFSALAESVVEQMEPVASARNITLTYDVTQNVVVQGDASWLSRLLLILLDNAIKFTPDGGQVAARVAATPDSVVLTVADTGIGIPPEAIPRLFERFYRVESSRSRQTPGTGLGLSLAQWIAERHGARIDVTSRPGAGTSFVVTFRKPPDVLTQAAP
ncbi:MAG: sensor histidine kinase [Vicinamibacterales bacterium]